MIGPRVVVFEDPGLPHQIVITIRAKNQIMVSCNCLRLSGWGRGVAYEPIEERTRWEAGEAIAVWRAHMAEAAA